MSTFLIGEVPVGRCNQGNVSDLRRTRAYVEQLKTSVKPARDRNVKRPIVGRVASLLAGLGRRGQVPLMQTVIFRREMKRAAVAVGLQLFLVSRTGRLASRVVGQSLLTNPTQRPFIGEIEEFRMTMGD